MSSPGLRSSIKAIAFNFICACCLAIVISLFSTVGKPYQRGFFCDDESISKPFKPGTVPSSVVVVVGLLLPVIFILIIEVPRFKEIRKEEEKTPFYNTHWFRWLVVVITFFIVGSAATALLTDTGKYTIGRLRPHFLAVCKPDFSSLNCSSGNEKHFITGDECTGDKDKIREARLSFPSGHASFSAYCMVFLALYIDIRMSFCNYLKLFKPLIQFVVILLAILCGLSRISDYKHHWGDVLTGFLLGTLIAIFFTYRVIRLLPHVRDSIAMRETVETQTIQNDPERGEQ